MPVHKLAQSFPRSADQFGYSVAISGSDVVVGATGVDGINGGSSPQNVGLVYIYDLASATPTTSKGVIANPTPAASDIFGSAVAIASPWIVVGTDRDDTGAAEAGSAYVYHLGNLSATPFATLNNPSPEAIDLFGAEVAVSGTRVVIGARLDNTGGTDAGQAYLYDMSSATPAVPILILSVPTLAADDWFGSAVSIEGTTIAIGASATDHLGPDQGAAYVFTPASLDFDNDGLLDLWEYAHFGSISAHTAQDDTDGDGRKELLEQAFDSNPLSFDSPATMPQVVSEGGFLTMTLNKRAGVSYTVETAGTPDDAAFSMANTTMITNTATTLKVRDNFTPATAVQRFMRVKVAPTP